MRVAIIHDYLNQYGGAERVLDELKIMFPDAPVFVAIHDLRRMPERYRDWDIRASWLNRVPLANRNHQMFLSLYPQAFESFNLETYDLVVSSSSGFAHGVLTPANTLNVCYCHSPPRFLWDYHGYADREQLGSALRAIVSTQLTRLRIWDQVSSARTDEWISTSRLVQQRITHTYGRDSTIIPPPVDTSRFEVGGGKGGYFLMLMRLVGWKRPEIVVEACNRLGLELVIAGDGRSLEGLKKIAGPTIKFVGRVNDVQMKKLYRDCKALILPSEEDFGITPLEALASGRPVIAFGKGGVLDTVIPGKTGLFFNSQTSDGLAEVLTEFREDDFDPAELRKHADTYDSTIFRQRMHAFINAKLAARAKTILPIPANTIPKSIHGRVPSPAITDRI